MKTPEERILKNYPNHPLAIEIERGILEVDPCFHIELKGYMSELRLVATLSEWLDRQNIVGFLREGSNNSKSE